MGYYKDQRFTTKNKLGQIHELRILSIEQKYIICRFKGCIPFVKSVKEFNKYLLSIEGIEIIK